MVMVRLGKKRYTVTRCISAGGWDEDTGEPLQPYTEDITIVANIQYAPLSNMMRLLPEGEWTKEAISIRSQERLYTSRDGVCIGDLLQPDLVHYNGTLWECRGLHQTFSNGVINHTEMIATRLTEQAEERVES